MTQTTGRGPERIALSTATTARGLGLPPNRTGRMLDRLARPGVAEVLLGVVFALFFVWRVGRSSPWFDEAIIRDVILRSAGEIVDLAEHVDLVHTTYYLLVHAVLKDRSFD